MRVLILAAGYGTRLKPLTNTCPKALVEVGGRPMLSYTLDLLEKYKIKDALINIHHFGEQVLEFVEQENKKRKIHIHIQDERDTLLGSGGSIAKAKDWLFEKDPFALIWNPDGLIFPNLDQLTSAHASNHKEGALATLNVLEHNDVGTRYKSVSMIRNKICGFGRKTPLKGEILLHFAGGYLLSQRATELLPPPKEVAHVGSAIWFPLMKQGKIRGELYSGLYQDLGSYSDIEIANNRIRAGEFRGQLR